MLQSWDLDKGHKLNVHLTTTQKDLADLVTFTEKILNGKLRFFCSVCSIYVFCPVGKYIDRSWVNFIPSTGMEKFVTRVIVSTSPQHVLELDILHKLSGKRVSN